MSDETKPTEQITQSVILTDLDAYISQRIKAQPPTLDDVAVAVKDLPDTSNRLSLPYELEGLSYDCTRGPVCKIHPWKYDEEKNRWSYGQHGKFIFRWLMKDKRAIDIAMNDRNWNLVNQRLFPELPRHLFSANGGIELGSAILAFLPVEVALRLRTAPVKKAQEILKSRIMRDKNSDDAFMMTGSPQPHQYMPQSERAVPGAAVEVKIDGSVQGVTAPQTESDFE